MARQKHPEAANGATTARPAAPEEPGARSADQDAVDRIRRLAEFERIHRALDRTKRR